MYSWDVSFTNPPGDLPSMTVGEAFALTDPGTGATIPDGASAVVSVATKQHGLARRSQGLPGSGSAADAPPALAGDSIQRVWVMVLPDDDALLADRLAVDSTAKARAAAYADDNATAFRRCAWVCACVPS